MYYKDAILSPLITCYVRISITVLNKNHFNLHEFTDCRGWRMIVNDCFDYNQLLPPWANSVFGEISSVKINFRRNFIGEN